MKATKAQRRTTAPPSKTAAIPIVQRPKLWPYAVGFLVGALAVFMAYGPSMNGPFLLDDTYLPYALPSYANAPLTEWMRGMRPLVMLSFWLNFKDGDTSTGAYHFFNVVLHLMNGGLIFLIVRRVLEWARTEAWRRDVLAVFAAGVFLLHPLQTESVSYIASRSEVLSIFFFLAAFAVFVYRRSATVSWMAAAGVLALFGAACLSKEHAVVLPAVLLLTDYYWNPGFSVEGIRRNWKIYVPIAVGAVAGLFFVSRVLSTATTAGFGMKDLTWYQYFFTQCRAIWRYVLFFVLPAGQNIDHDFPVSKTILDYGAIVGLIGLIALIGAAWYYRKRFPVESYGVLLVLILLAPTSSVIPIRDQLVEHRMYLPFIGFVLVTVGLLRRWKTSRPALVAALGAILLIEAGLTYARNQLWGNQVAMWADSVEKSPAKFRPHFQLAYAYYNSGQCAEAVRQFAKTAEFEKPQPNLLIDWALAWDCAGNFHEAVAKLQQSAAIEKSAHVYSQIGMEYAKMTQYPQALDALDTAVKMDPNFEMTYVYRGNVYALIGNRQGAAADYRHALQIDPQNQTARAGLARLSQQ